MSRYELTIEETAPSPNKLMRAHWATRKRLWDKWAWLVRLEAIPPEKPLTRALVRIVRYGARLLDEDNLVGAQKPLIDALVRNGYLVDDSPKHCQIRVTQEKKPKGAQPRTMVLIEAI